LRELITWLKANPNKASMAVGFTGSRLLATYLQQQTGTQFTLVPYRGAAPAMQDLVAGQIDLSIQFPFGTVRLACRNGLTVAPPAAKITAGARPTNSTAYWRRRSSSPAPQR
jgi:hypothetical protein